MSQEVPEDHISRKRVLYQLSGMDAVLVRRDVEFEKNEAGALTMDVYYPPNQQSETRVPVVIIIAGYPDAGFQKFVGCKFKEMGSSVSWAQLIAASGMAAITYTNRDPEESLNSLLGYLREHTAELGIDASRIGMWACSGNVPLALSALMAQGPGWKCAAFLYGYMLDLDGATGVADVSKIYKFANPGAGKTVDDLPEKIPIFIAKAGEEQNPGLNDSIERFVFHAIARNLPITFVNHPAGPHSFDLLDNSDTTREIVQQVLAFLGTNVSK